MHVAMENVFLQMLNKCPLEREKKEEEEQNKMEREWDREIEERERERYTLTPAEWTMHLGVPVVPDEYMMNRGWLKGSCSNCSSEPS